MVWVVSPTQAPQAPLWQVVVPSEHSTWFPSWATTLPHDAVFPPLEQGHPAVGVAQALPPDVPEVETPVRSGASAEEQATTAPPAATMRAPRTATHSSV